MRSDPPISQSACNKINNSEWSEDYYKQYIPSYNNTAELAITIIYPKKLTI